jgi:predicted Zn-dependent protease
MAAHFSNTVGPRRSLLVILVLAASLSIAGCQREGEGPGHREQPLALTPQEELQLGRQAYDEILRNAEVLTGGPEVDQVYRVSRRVAQALRIEPLQQEINLHLSGYRFEWQYSVIASDQINAFCLPGGKIGVFTGLLRVVRNDDQLAAVIAHEIAHALAHHASERIARARSTGNPLLTLAYDRAQESEADHIGLFLMTFAGYDPGQAVVFWKEMQAVAERGARRPEILSDHPSDTRRIRQLEDWVPMVKAAKRAYDEGRIASPREGRKPQIP